MSDDVPFECFNKKSLCAYVSNKIINQETFSESINLRMLSTNEMNIFCYEYNENNIRDFPYELSFYYEDSFFFNTSIPITIYRGQVTTKSCIPCNIIIHYIIIHYSTFKNKLYLPVSMKFRLVSGLFQPKVMFFGEGSN
jgi:hypothetical protein